MNGSFHRPDASPGRPLISAHRGCSASAPENTMAAFRRALEAGVDVLELDVHLTRDDRVAVIHDRTLQRTTTGNGPVRSYAAKEIAGFDAGSWFDPAFASERVPMLEEVLELARGRCRVNVELKSHRFFREPAPRYAERVVSVVRDAGMLDAVLFSSFDPDLLVHLRAGRPSIQTGVLYNWHRDLFRGPVAIAARCGANVFISSHSELTQRRLQEARVAGLAVAVYTVNEPAEAVRFADLGVDMVISDAPDRILRAFEAR